MLPLRSEQIINQLHKIQRDDPLINELSGSIGSVLDEFDGDIEDFKRQLDVRTATWALPIYEKEYGIKPDVSKTLDERRSQILAKMRSSTGKISLAMIKAIVDAYTKSASDAWFNGRIHVRIHKQTGVNLKDIHKAINEIKPAHIPVDYEVANPLSFVEYRKVNMPSIYQKVYRYCGTFAAGGDWTL
jgi:hypothetical protein